MNRLLVILGVLLSSFSYAGLHTYSEHSVLKEGQFLKVSVKETGVHMMTYEQLKSWGLNPAQL